MTELVLRHRLVTLADIPDVATWLALELPTSIPAELMADLMATLLDQQMLRGILIEKLQEDRTRYELVGLGLSAFVEPDLMTSYVQTPRPFVFIDLLERTQRGQTRPLGPTRIARDNAGDGLDLIVHYMQGGWDLSAPLWRAVGAIGHMTYVDYHRGFHLQRVLQEDWTSNAPIYLAAGYRELTQLSVDTMLLPAAFCVPAQTRTLFYGDAADINARAPGSSLSYIFQRLTPRCYFPPSEQRLLEAALEGTTDREVALALDLSPTTIKSLWRQIYQRVGMFAPHVLPLEEVESETRGPEKKRRVLAFVKDNPQELRAYARSKVGVS